jgi:hypothetical protein
VHAVSSVQQCGQKSKTRLLPYPPADRVFYD